MCSGICPSDLGHVHAATYRTDSDITIPDRFQKFSHGHICKLPFEFLISLKFKNQSEVSGFHAVVQESVVTDLLKSRRQDMQKETTNELLVFQRDLPPGTTGNPAPGREGSLCLRYRKDPAVGDGNLMCIASQILNGIAKAVEGLFDERAPVSGIKLISEFIPGIGITEVLTGMGEAEPPILVISLQKRKIFPLEFIA